MSGYNENAAQLDAIRESIRRSVVTMRAVPEDELTQHGKEATLDAKSDDTLLAILKRTNQLFTVAQQTGSSLMTTIEILQALQKQMNELETTVANIQNNLTEEGNVLGLAVEAMTGVTTQFSGLKVELDQILAAVSEAPAQIVRLDVKFDKPTDQPKVVSLKPSDEVNPALKPSSEVKQ